MSAGEQPSVRAVTNVLIVEDDPAMEAEAIAAVSIFTGASVRTARTVAEAERWIKRVQFDLAIIDIGLPRMDGLELTRRLRQPGMASRTMPVLILTGFSHRLTPERIAAARAHAVLLKPVALEDLRKSVDDALASVRG